jgi:hypothetical protein
VNVSDPIRPLRRALKRCAASLKAHLCAKDASARHDEQQHEPTLAAGMLLELLDDMQKAEEQRDT